MKKVFAAALLAVLAGPAFAAQELQVAFVQARNSINATRFTLSIAGACDAGPFAVPTWCAAKAEGVVGGVKRELRAPAGRRVRFQLSNLPGSWSQPQATARVFALVPENSSLPAGGCPKEALACAVIPLGVEDALWIGLEVGTYKYYDPSWPGSGYGVLKVVPDEPAGI